jgi:hypothetical protein
MRNTVVLIGQLKWNKHTDNIFQPRNTSLLWEGLKGTVSMDIVVNFTK